MRFSKNSICSAEGASASPARSTLAPWHSRDTTAAIQKEHNLIVGVLERTCERPVAYPTGRGDYSQLSEDMKPEEQATCRNETKSRTCSKRQGTRERRLRRVRLLASFLATCVFRTGCNEPDAPARVPKR